MVGTAVAVIPWNNFSNSRALRPRLFYSRLLGRSLRARGIPRALCACRAGGHRHHQGETDSTSRFAAAVGALIFGITGRRWYGPHSGNFPASMGGYPDGVATVAGPMFLMLFAFWLLAAWLGAMALGKRSRLQLRAAAVVAVAAGAVACFFVWNIATEQRLQLAMRDVAGLERTDVEANFLLTRFGQDLAQYETPGDRRNFCEGMRRPILRRQKCRCRCRSGAPAARDTECSTLRRSDMIRSKSCV